MFILLLCWLEKRKEKIMKKTNYYTKSERKLLDQKLKEGPEDVYNEWKKIQQTVINKNHNNDIAFKVFELNKDFKISKLKMKWKKFKESLQKKKNSSNNYENIIDDDDDNDDTNSNNNNNNNNTSGKTIFEKMDDRVYYDEKSKRYKSRIVDDVTFGVNAGDCLGLLGPNGAGKTTFISMITGLLDHTHGQIYYGNTEYQDANLANSSIGYCPQEDALWELLTVKETIEFYLSIGGYPKKYSSFY